MLKVLYLLNFAGKAGTERYVETLVKYLAADGLVQPPPLRQKGRP